MAGHLSGPQRLMPSCRHLAWSMTILKAAVCSSEVSSYGGSFRDPETEVCVFRETPGFLPWRLEYEQNQQSTGFLIPFAFPVTHLIPHGAVFSQLRVPRLDHWPFCWPVSPWLVATDHPQPLAQPNPNQAPPMLLVADSSRQDPSPVEFRPILAGNRSKNHQVSAPTSCKPW